MKSENDLIITGTVTSDVQPAPGQTTIRFRIVHNFGGRNSPLFLDCILIVGRRTDVLVPRKGDQVRLRAYLRMRSGSIEAVVKSLQIK